MTANRFDTYDEGFDAHVSRPIASRVGPWLHARGVSANVVSLAGAAVGVGAGFALAGQGLWPLVGMFLLLAFLVIDCIDGAIARLQPPSDKPWKGRIFDGLCDATAIIGLVVGMTVHLSHLNLSVYGITLGALGWSILGVATFAALTFATQALDKVKHRLKPGSPDHRVAEFAAMPMTLGEKVLFWIFSVNAAGDHSYREGDELRYRLLIVQGPTTRFVVAALAALMTAFYPSAFLAYMALTWLSVLYVIAVEFRVRRLVAVRS